eukprot:TRINITY_DN42872_c0_g1_i1.p1 TRINITY_DN42872_c0_g1~~TRINITY_DN42872_c0_g1_i1.p1  ORF type:complete len:1394 (+),score=210.79 TRINITY_DN42872_c0_g1_i1:230-4411(+)
MGEQPTMASADDNLDVSQAHRRHPLERQAGCLSKAKLAWNTYSFLWLQPLLRLGARRPLQLEDIWEMPPEYKAAQIFRVAENAWASEVARGDKKPSLMRVLFGITRHWFPVWLCCVVVFLVVQGLLPNLLKKYLELLEDETASTESLLLYSTILVICYIMMAAVMPNAVHIMRGRFGTVWRFAVQGLIYRGLLHLNQETRLAVGSSVVNLMSVDAERFSMVTEYANSIQQPLLLVVISGVMVYQIGWVALLGVGLLAATLPLMLKIGNLVGKARRSMVMSSDARVRATSQCINGVRIFKMHGWTPKAHSLIASLRRKETEALSRLLRLRGLNMLFGFVVPSLAALVVFGTHVALGGKVSPSIVFPVLGMLKMVQLVMVVLPQFVSGLADFKVAHERVKRFLILAFQDPWSSDSRFGNTPDGLAIQLQSASFAWRITEDQKQLKRMIAKGKGKGKGAGKCDGKDVESTSTGDKSNGTGKDGRKEAGNESQCKVEDNLELRDINLAVPEGGLCIILGPVGSGKTSLLQAILGEMRMSESSQGSCRIREGLQVRLCGQEPWIQSANLRDNVLYNREFDEAAYYAAVSAAQLSVDIESLPQGDQTEIGERGINLSGGQKARVALARALYGANGNQLLILDDVLSAVDAEVGARIVQQGLLGVLRKQTRVIVSNTFLHHLLPSADVIVVLSKGCVEVQGSLSDVLSGSAWLRSVYGDGPTQDQMDRMQEAGAEGFENDGANATPQIIKKPKLAGSPSAVEGKDSAERDSGKLYTAEERVVGVLSLDVYKQYFARATRRGRGGCTFAGLLLLILVAELVRTSGELWIATWAAQSSGSALIRSDWLEKQNVVFWIGGLGVLVALLIPAGIIKVTSFMATAARIAQNTHDTMLNCILRAPVNTYFDVTPTGRILNRFSRDLDSMDMQLPIFMFSFLENSFFVVSVLSVACASSYTILVVVPLLAIIFVWTRRFFAASMREIKRIEGITRSPLYSLFAETSTGLSHIRAFGMVEHIYSRYAALADQNFRVYFHQIAAGPWLGQRLNILAGVLVSSIAYSGALMPRRPGHASLIGFALSTSLGLMGRLIQTTMMSIETENHMTAVERLQHFSSIPQEPLDTETSPLIGTQQLQSAWKQNWPSAGCIKFENVSMCYRPGLPDVLQDLSISIPAGQSVGIIGRTGSGKSSTMLAILRFVEPRSGAIYIDGTDIAEVPLQQLRASAVSIIPQDPYLFEGSVRENLDPFSAQNEAELWQALEQVSVAEAIKNIGGLEAKIAEGAENLSAGQRQLMCIARAMLRHPKIVLVDEATASIDTVTDQVIQSSLRTCFKGCTCLTIAHRLETIVESDRIICLSNGRLKEEGSPKKLLADTRSEFAQMAAHAGLSVLDKEQQTPLETNAIVAL